MSPITNLQSVLNFDGQGACIDLGIKPQFKIEQNITLEVWIYAEKNQQEWTGIVSNVYDTETTESGYCLALDGKGGVYFGMTPSSTKRIIYLSSGSNSLAVNEWHHVAGVYDGQQMKVYIDGVEKGTQAVTSPSISYDPENNLHIGAYKDNDEAYYFHGKIAEFRLWNIACSQEDICKNIHHRLSGDEPGLVGYWPLNESCGNTACDRTPNANHGFITGANWVESQLPVNNLFLYFYAKDDSVNLGKKPQFKIENTITLEAWVYVEQNKQGWPGIVNNVWDTGTTESGYGLLLDGQGGIYLAITPSSTKRIIYLSSGANSLTINEWHHIAGTYDGQQMKVYIDGVQKAAQAVSGFNISYAPENDLRIGMYKDNDETYAFKGKIAGVRLWNIARSQVKIQEDMSRYLPGNEPGLVGYWLLNEGSGNRASDRTANGNHGAIIGAVWV